MYASSAPAASIGLVCEHEVVVSDPDKRVASMT
jgi:hypothetical protein